MTEVQSKEADKGGRNRPPGEAGSPTPATPSAGAPAAESSPNPGLLALIREDYIAHGRDWTKPGFRALAAYRFGAWRMTLGRSPIRWLLGLIHRALFRYARNHYGIEIPWSAKLGRRVIIEHQSGIVIHGDSVIGDDCIIRQGVTLGIRSMQRLRDAPILGKRVNVGAGAKILGRVTLGDGCTIGANAVVLTDVPPGATAVGVPARVVSEGGSRPEPDDPGADRR